MSLYDKWHEFSKKGGLDAAGCQILTDWKREADQLRTVNEGIMDINKKLGDELKCLEGQLSEAHAREAGLREALKGMLLSADCRWEELREGHDWPEACEKARKALSSPSPVVERVRKPATSGPPIFFREVPADAK